MEEMAQRNGLRFVGKTGTYKVEVGKERQE